MHKTTLIASLLILILAGCGGAEDPMDAAGMVGDGGGVPEGEGGLPPPDPATHTVQVTLHGDGEGAVLSDGDGIACGDGMTACTMEVRRGTELTLRASAIAPSRFAGWSGHGLECMGSEVCTLTVTSNLEIGATFTLREVALMVSTSGDGAGAVRSEPAGIDCGATCSASFPEGSLVRLRVTPEEGSIFAGWSGACAGVDDVCTVRLDASAEVRAELVRRRHTLEVEPTGDGAGTIVSDPAGIDCGTTCSMEVAHGERVTLTATPAPGTAFAGWIGCEASGPTCEVTATEARRIQARFETNRYALTVTTSGAGRGVVRSDPAGIDCGADCAEAFEHGAVVTLTASPDAGSTFEGWSGACSGADATCLVTMSEARTIEARFAVRRWELEVQLAGTGSGRVTSSPAGVDCGSRCGATFEHDARVTLTATDDASSTFAGWGGACTGTSRTCTVAMTEARAVTATFALGERELTVTRVGSGSGAVTSSPAGIDCGTDCTHEFDHGTTVTLTATPDATSTFEGWSGACSGTSPTCTVRVTSPLAVSASFALRPRTLTVTRAGSGNGTVGSSPAGISCGGECAATFDHGTTVTLSATASAADSRFAGWSGACSGSATTCTVSMTEARNVTATFTLLSRTLSVARAGNGAGSVTSSPAGIACGTTCDAAFAHGTLVTLTAAEDVATSTFAGWTGACAGASRSCAVSMTEARSVTATFTLVPRALAVTLAGTGTGSVSSMPAGIACGADCTEDYDHGTMVTLTAAPESATSSFAGWSGACMGATATCTVAMTEARMVTARFDLLSRRLTVGWSGSGAGSVSSMPAGLSCASGSTCGADFPHGTDVVLTAVENGTTSSFGGWTGCASTSGNTCTVSMTAARSVTARFDLLSRRLTVGWSGSGAGSVSSMPAGLSCASGSACGADFPHGTDVVLTAAANGATSSFGGWTGCASTSGNVCTVSMTAARSVTARFDLLSRRLDVRLGGTASGSVASSPGGISCGSTCSASYSHGTSVTLTATPSSGNVTVAWDGACAGVTGNTCTLSMTSDRGVGVIFNPVQRVLRVAREGAGYVRSSPGGIDCGTRCETTFDHGTSVTLTAIPDEGWEFAGWQGACSGEVCTIAMNGDRSALATFRITTRRITVRISGSGSVSAEPAGLTCVRNTCAGDYDYGTRVRLRAEPGTYARFDSWSGATCLEGSQTTATCTVEMTAARDLIAAFAPTHYHLGVSTVSAGTVTGSGISCPSDCSEYYPINTSVSLTARPASGYTFLRWVNAPGCSTSTLCTVRMDQHHSVTAEFQIRIL
ncbi:MAG: InlB B-repeat-containing protein [Sandaracinaceae bacterium]|nr:InlB B-repeat-containing protein [Sandaracinaceae bacterium]